MYGFNIKIVGEMPSDAELAPAYEEQVRDAVSRAVGQLVASEARVDCVMINGRDFPVRVAVDRVEVKHSEPDRWAAELNAAMIRAPLEARIAELEAQLAVTKVAVGEAQTLELPAAESGATS